MLCFGISGLSSEPNLLLFASRRNGSVPYRTAFLSAEPAEESTYRPELNLAYRTWPSFFGFLDAFMVGGQNEVRYIYFGSGQSDFQSDCLDAALRVFLCNLTDQIQNICTSI